MRSAALGVRIEESNDPSELVPDHLLPVQFTDLLQRPSERTPEHKLMAALLEEAIRTFCRCAGARGARRRRLFREARQELAEDVSRRRRPARLLRPCARQSRPCPERLHDKN